MKSVQAKNITEQNWPVPLRQLLASRQIKQIDLAQKAELGQSAISNYLSGERVPGAWELYRLASALSVSMEYLLTGEKSPNWTLNESPEKSVKPETRKLMRQLLDTAKALDVELSKY